MALFKYDPIDLTQPAFRLARLLKGSGVEIHCEIFQAFLGKPESIIPYEALSYTWGSTEITDSITIDESELGVTQNLYLALQYLRLENEDRILWIDGLCINQKNNAEKGHQVQQMDNIYCRAERVLIWLGPATYETNVLMDSMKQLEKESINYSRNKRPAWRDLWSTIQPSLRNIHSDLEVRQRDGLQSLFGRPWFSRVWILQEVANARAAIVLCGNKSVSARIFALVPSLMGSTPDPHCQSVLDIMPGLSRQQSWWSQKRDLHTLLAKFGKSEASDPRDNIYALLSLSSDACDSDVLRADYSKPVNDVINQAASFLLRLPELRYTDFLSDWTMPQFLEVASFLSNVALVWAQDRNKEPMIKLLLERDDIEANLEDKDGITPLQNAMQKSKEEIVKLFLRGITININSKDKDGITLLERAMQGGLTGIVQQFVAYSDFDVNSEDKQSITLLQTAVQNGCSGIVELFFIYCDVDVNSKDDDGRTMLQSAVQGGYEMIVQLLLKYDDVDVTLKDEDGQTLLLSAMEQMAEKPNFNKIVKLLLLREDVDVNFKGKNEFTPLLRAAENNDVEVTGLLLTRGEIEVNSTDKYGDTLLHKAVMRRHTEIVELLLARDDIDVNALDKRGRTPLAIAVENYNKKTVELLLARKDIDANLEGNAGQILQQMAIQKENRTVEEDFEEGVEEGAEEGVREMSRGGSWGGNRGRSQGKESRRESGLRRWLRRWLRIH